MSQKPTIKIALTGHRSKDKADYDYRSPANIAGAKKLREHLLAHLSQGKRVHAISGMAIGWDTIFALVVLKLRDQGYDIMLECAIPCEGQSNIWPEEAQKRWKEIVDKADKVTYVTRSPYMAYLMQIRNQYMVNLCDELIAMWDGRLSGGTFKCVKYAEDKGVKIVRINPNTFVLELKGDLLKSDCDVILHQANCMSTMGSGIADQIRLTYGQAYRADKEFPLPPNERLGKYSSARITTDNRFVEVVNLYGQLRYGKGLQTNYGALQAALFMYFNDKLKSAGTLKGLKFGMPTGMGCGRAGGDWNIVLKILEDLAQAFNITLYTYTYQEEK